MLNDADYIDWCLQLGLAEITRATITAARSRNPTRRVGGGRQNVSGRYPSRKMGVTIQFESHRVELPFVYEMEHDPAVLEYYDQPPSIPLAYPTAGGRGCRSCILRIISFFATALPDGLSAKPKAILKNWPSRVRTATFGMMLATGAVRRAKLTPRHWAWTTGYGHRLKSIGTSSVTCNSSTIISDTILGTQRGPSMPRSKR